MNQNSQNGEPKVERFPLFFNPSVPYININYMHQNINAWDISKLEQPLNLYQPDVCPTPEGGYVRDPDVRQRKTKGNFVIVNKEYIKTPEEQSWYMYTNDKKVFKGTPFEFKGAVISHNDHGFYLSFCDNAIKFAPELNVDAKNGNDLDKIQKKMKREKESAKVKNSSLVNYKVVKELQEREYNQKQNLKGSDSDADIDDDFDDDDELLGDDLLDEIPELSDGIDLAEESESSVGEEEDKKDKKEKRKEALEAQKGTIQQTEEEIINEAIGKPVIKEDDIVRFFKDMGMVQSRDLISRFKSMLETDKQKAAFKEILKRRVRQVKRGGITYLQMK